MGNPFGNKGIVDIKIVADPEKSIPGNKCSNITDFIVGQARSGINDRLQ